jgi:protein gp37
MADHSQIEWTDATWNPITGCSVVSPGCTNCYAMGLAGGRMRNHPSRVGLTRETKAGPVWTGEVRLNQQWLTQPLGWKRPRMIFVCAHGDLFHEDVPDEWIDLVFAIMAITPRHTYQVLTKRSARMRDYIGTRAGDWMLHWPDAARAAGALLGDVRAAKEVSYPLSNVCLGVSAEDQRRADERVPHLLATPAAVRFVSAEPLLGPIDFRRLHPGPMIELTLDALTGTWTYTQALSAFEDASRGLDIPALPARLPRLDGIIVGGESGAGARPMHPDWPRAIRDQCGAAFVPFFFKQWGSWKPICAMADGDVDELYEPPPAEHPDASRRCKVPALVLDRDGARFDLDCWSRIVRKSTEERPPFWNGFGSMTMFDVGKKAAGRLLDGVEHNALPGARQ